MASPNQSLEEIKAAYEKFLALKGEVFEVKSIDMNAGELELVKKAERFNRRITFPFFMAMGVLSMGGGVWALWSGFIIPGLGLLVGAVAVGAFGLSYSGYKQESPRHKVVITGIVTGRKTYNRQFGKSYLITLSRKKDLFIAKEDYDKIRLGDLVQYETLSETQEIKSGITRLGHINDVMSSS
jgi:hypothetical protein